MTADQWSPGDQGIGYWLIKGHKETSGDDGNVYYLDYNCFRGVYIFQNVYIKYIYILYKYVHIKLYILKCVVYFMQIVSQ